ncbi:unnamed protein product [Tetraodon nigroviridis]|uniref:(spotted green pufferfish) hypothetical protein n=1 Tax=Tetraodon nigroviridis TaxID=99883 RepID=Q4SZK6_TETNG|nr:unnamed protein product [Tetraodon nigroviridis]
MFAVGLLFAIGQGLQCYNCKLGLWNLCLTTKVTCAEGQHCYSGVGEAAGVVNIMMKGCLAVAECNKSSNLEFSTQQATLYTMNKTCCSTDFCNAAPGMPGASSIGLALATITALIMTQVVV